MAEVDIQRNEQNTGMSPFVWIAVVIVIVAGIWWALAMSSSRRMGMENYGAPATSGATSNGTAAPGAAGGMDRGAATGGTSGSVNTMPGQKVGEPGVGEPVAPSGNPGSNGGPGSGGSAEGAH